MAEKVWYYCRPGGDAAGPVSSRRLRRMATDGRLARGDLLSRRPGGRQVRADTIAGLFAPSPPLPPPVEVDRPYRRSRSRAESSAGGLLDLSFTRFVTPKLVKVLWAVWLFGAVPLLTLAIVAIPVMTLAGMSVAEVKPTRMAAHDPMIGQTLPPQPTGTTGVSVLSVVGVVVLAIVQLVALALYTLLVRVMLESVVVMFRGAEAVMAINARQRGEE